MGVAGMVMSSGCDALWYPVRYACGCFFLLLFIGLFYTMPQMKGAGTTPACIFPGVPYRGGVVLVGAVITLNVAPGGMKGITLVQAFQYWAKMTAISLPVFVLLAADATAVEAAQPAIVQRVVQDIGREPSSLIIALVCGTAGLFVTLAIVMYATRKVNWYEQGGSVHVR